MKEIMGYEICKAEHLRRVDPDPEKVNSILRMCKARQRLTENALLDSETASIIASDYYEIIKELLVALLLQNGYKSDNHECLISFFKHTYPSYEYEVTAIHQLKYIRNRASYDGIFVRQEYVINNRLEFKGIIELIGSLIAGNSPSDTASPGSIS